MRFGLLVNGPFLQRWQYQTVQHLLDDGHILVVAVGREETFQPVSFFSKVAKYPYQWFIYRFWQRFFFRPKAKNIIDISEILTGIDTIKCLPEVRGKTEWIPDEVVGRVRQHNPDFLLRFGFNIIRGGILEAAVYGVWSFHHDDEQVIRGGPPGFWEVFNGHNTNGVMLQRLTEKLDAGPIIDKIWLPVIRHSYKAHLDMLLSESAFMPARACRSIALHGVKTRVPETVGRLYRNPKNMSMLRFMLKIPARRIGFHLQQLFRQESWCIGLAVADHKTMTIRPELSDLSVRWIKHPDRTQYFADPFIVDFQGQTIILAEQFSYHTGRGRLVRLLPENDYQAVEVQTPDELHRSFPFLFVHGGKLFCLPECYTSRTITLFEFNPDNNHLENPRVLLRNVDALDPLLFEHEGRWWLLYSRKHLPGIQLFAWYAESPFGPFRPHRLNPLKTDPRSTRNAGAPFMMNGFLIRPAQDIAGTYGKAVVMNRVEVLTPEDFSESPLGRLEPDSSWQFNQGLHTFNGNGNLIVLDAKTYRFSLAGFRHVWKQKTARKV